MEIRRSYSFASDGDFYNGDVLFIHKAVSVSSAWDVWNLGSPGQARRYGNTGVRARASTLQLSPVRTKRHAYN